MVKNIIYFLVLVCLAFATYWFVFKEHKQTFDIKEANFSVKDTADVTKIFISNMNAENITLTRTQKGWLANDSFTIKPNLINKVLEALQTQEARNPVEMAKHDNVVKAMSTESNKVEVYCKGVRTNVFYVNRNPNKENLCYMLTEGAKRPYVVALPLTDNFVGRRYITNLNEWRSNMLFNTPMNDIEKVEVKYADSVKYNYTITNAEKLTVTGGYDIPKPVNTKRVTSYLSFFTTIQIFGYETSAFLKEKGITNGVKLGELLLTRKDKSSDLLEIYFRPLYQGSKGVIKIGNKEFDNDSFFGLYNKRDFIAINRAMTEKIFRSYPEFYEADTTNTLSK
jgi:hypothetical protein